MLCTALLITALAQADEPDAGPSLEERVRLLEERLAAQAPDAGEPAPPPSPASDYAPEKVPFAFADFSWAPANNGGPNRPFSFGPFTGEFRVDAAYHHSFAEPQDNTLSGSSEVFRHGEFQLTQLGFGGDFYYKGAHGRLMTQFGMYSQTTPRNDPSAARGQWRLDDAYRYVSEAYVGYHFDVQHGVNVQAGIFMSYVGLWSYYNFDNWTYQPSYVSSNTPWFFNGMRIQWFPNEHLKIEPWLVNGWQAYGRFNNAPGVGLQVQWRPTHWFQLISNNYVGTDTLGNPDLKRVHTDDSVMAKVYDRPEGFFSRAAASLTLDAGCEWGQLAGAGVGCSDRFFLGFMAYARLWFLQNRVGFTGGGGAIQNPGWYLVLVPPINGATAYSGSPYLDTATQYRAWDLQLSLDFHPIPYVQLRAEFNHRAANVPYFSGSGGVTPPGGNTGAPGSVVAGWAPDLRYTEDRVTFSMGLKL